MAKYLIVASYTSQGVKGVIAKGGTARREAVEKMAADLGGHVESFYFAFGEGDAFVTVDLPDNVGAAAVGLAVGASGMAATRTIVLLTPEEIDRAAATQVNYAPPGS
ncbi:MAG: GYD domain-containing protein [Actinomycetota bacterium]